MNLFKKSFIGVSIFVVIFSVIYFSPTEASTTYNINGVPCGYYNQPGYTTALCDAHIDIENDNLGYGDSLNVSWNIDQSGYLGIVGLGWRSSPDE